MESIVNELIKYFLEEKDHPIIDIPESYVNKREFLRGLINVREPKQLPQEIINKENELLRLELQEKELVSASDFKDRFCLWQGDITTIKVGAIINYATPKLTGCFKPNHNCIDNKIHSNAGISLRLKCKEITGGEEIDVSKVVLTKGYNLPCKYIIHVVEPNLDEITNEVKDEIEEAMINVLDLAKNNKIDTICIPNMSVKSEDKNEIANIIFNTIYNYLKEDTFFKKVIINVFTLESHDIYNELFKKVE